jgi:hypothetical protein
MEIRNLPHAQPPEHLGSGVRCGRGRGGASDQHQTIQVELVATASATFFNIDEARQLCKAGMAVRALAYLPRA